ncbi:hypothetical protein [Pseudonocardia broussonetiae]|uniref:Uncharacterized protein n=1 Tax=Pseudonocardia broussonetiae TaxID=2736640 RepID=A0A6M6JFG1_9PSEU|nr:hypothetical protein [Pseudonocardia broussonetiae]QJY46684.1 hypothetical protein HOP40_13345 [Pseudonocardia broussonetiae]
MSRVERLRWRIVRLVDKLPGQCWSELADWAGRWFAGDDPDEQYGLPWRPQGWMCREDAARVGSCYCGKLQDPAGAARAVAEQAVRDAHRQGPRADGSWGCACGWEQDKPHHEHLADMLAPAVPGESS